jgi:hypothetical protein
MPDGWSFDGNLFACLDQAEIKVRFYDHRAIPNGTIICRT